MKIKSADFFGDNWKDELAKDEKKIIEDYFANFLSFKNKIGFISLIVGGKELNIKFDGPNNKGISFEVPRNSLLTACKNRVFDDLLIGNFMKTRLHNLNSLYDKNANFTYEVAKFGDGGMAYSKEELAKYNSYYAKKMGKEYFLDMFAHSCKDYFKFFYKNYQNSKYYEKIKKVYYYLLK